MLAIVFVKDVVDNHWLKLYNEPIEITKTDNGINVPNTDDALMGALLWGEMNIDDDTIHIENGSFKLE